MGRKYTSLVFAALFILPLLMNNPGSTRIPLTIDRAEDVSQSTYAVLNLSSTDPSYYKERLVRDLGFFRNVTDRSIGSKGYYKAYEYLRNTLNESTNGNIHVQVYRATVPIDEGSFMSVNRNGVYLNITIHPLHPLGGVPVNARVKGRGVVLKDLRDADGVNLNGSVVFIDLGVDWSWINLLDPSLGVKAVVFYSSYRTSRSNALNKMLDTPINLPLAFVSTEELSKSGVRLEDLNGADVEITIKSRWEEKEAFNIVGYIKGVSSEYVVALIAHYDSFTPVVGVAPGASDILAPLYLIYFAEKNNAPRYDTLIILLSGHYQGLVGARLFVEEFIFNPNPLRFGGKTLTIDPKRTLFIGLDLNYDSKFIAPLSIGYFYSAQSLGITYGPIDYYKSFITSVFNAETLALINDTVFKRLVEYSWHHSTWWQLVPGPYWLDTEPFWSSGLAAFTLKTVFSDEHYRFTPEDRVDRVLAEGNLDNVIRQFQTVDRVLGAIYMKGLGEMKSCIADQGLSPRSPTRVPVSGRNEMFAKLIGRVLVWDPVSGARRSINEYGYERALVLIKAGSRIKTTNTWNVRLALFTDNEGYFEVSGLHNVRATSLEIVAIVFEGDEVALINSGGAAARGGYVSIGVAELGSRDAPWEVWVLRYNGTIVLTQQIDPTSYLTPVEGGSIGLKIVEADTHSTPQYFVTFVDETGLTVIYLDRDVSYDIVVGPEPALYVYRGVRLGNRYGLLYALNSTIALCRERLNELLKHKVTSISAEKYLNLSIRSLDYALGNLSRYNYTLYFANLYVGISSVHQCYSLTKSTFMDVTVTGVLYSVLLVVSSIAVGLIFRKPGESPVKTLLKTVVTLVSIGFVFGLLHPAFTLVSSAVMVVVGFTALILCIPILFVLIKDFNEALRVVKKRTIGIHEVTVSKVATGFVAFSYGIEHMKKRKLRTLLTVVTLVVIVVSVIAFTSLTTYVEPKPVVVRGVEPTRASGFLLQIESIDRNLPLGRGLEVVARSRLSDRSYARYWHPGQALVVNYDSPGTEALTLDSIIAMDLEEDTFLNISRILVNGSFDPGGGFIVAIPDTLVKASGGRLNVNSTIVIAGVKLRVAAVYDRYEFLKMVDLDGGTLAPVIGFPRIRARDIAIIPRSVAEENPWLSKGVSFFIAQISVYTGVSGASNELGEAIYILPSLDFYSYLNGGSVLKYSKLEVVRGAGFSFIIPPLIIVTVSILSVILGNLYERRREIYIYAAVGLSPTQIGLMFLAETIAYGLIAILIGYPIGIGLTRALSAIAPEAFKPNYGSGYVAISLGFTMLAVVLASLYPIYKAGKMALPSLRRRWEFTTKPVGDEWTVPFPFKFTSVRDLIGAFNYVLEYIGGFVSPDIGNFVVEKVGLIEKEVNGAKAFSLEGEVRLKPWQAGVKQFFEVRAINVGIDEWDVTIHLKRLSGDRGVWVKSNKHFIDTLRKQLLLWRTLPLEDKKAYLDRSLRM